MSGSSEDAFLTPLAAALAETPGVVAVALGGSRGRRRQQSGSDWDVGLYYRAGAPIDVAALDAIAARADDRHERGLVTPLGGWGPWVNGGGWLKVGGRPVDLIYRDLDRVELYLANARRGELEIGYQTGHPHGVTSGLYLGEVATCRPLLDRAGLIARLKAELDPYPEPLRRALARRFLSEARFFIAIAGKAAGRADVAYVAGCAFRAEAALMQALFALNRVWLLNEKGALAMAAGFPLAPDRLRPRLEAVLGHLGCEPAALAAALAALGAIAGETADLCAELVAET